MLGLDLHSWEQWMLLALGLAALAAVAVVVTTASVVILQRHETAQAKHELEAYKVEAGEKIAAADAVGKAAQADAAKAVADTAKANERTAELARETEKLRATNLEMEKAFSPRSLTITGADREKLKAFGKVRWVIEYVAQDEPRDFASQIIFLLNAAEWVHFDGPIPDRPGSPAFGVSIYLSNDAAEPAAIALKQVLKTSDIEATIHHIGAWRLKDIAPDGIQISVGRKPSLSMDRLLKATTEQFEQERAEAMEQWRKKFRDLPLSPSK